MDFEHEREVKRRLTSKTTMMRVLEQAGVEEVEGRREFR